MDAAKVRRETGAYRGAYPADAAEWMGRHGLNPETRPKFAEGTDAVRRVLDACGMTQAALARACGKAPATVSAWAKAPEGVRPANVRALIDAAAGWFEGGPDTFVRLVRALMDGPSLPETPHRYPSAGAVSAAWEYLTDAQRAAVVEAVRAMVAANGGPADLFADCGDASARQK